MPKFECPPVVETVLSAQFARLEKFSAGHAGWFWKELNGDWTDVQSAPRLEDQFERFGDEVKWGPLGSVRVITGTEPERLQILRKDNERMIQVQDSRFIYNWRKQQADYPSYEKVLHEFRREFAAFESFVKDAALGRLELNQWEVTYVNHIPKGELWNSVSNWRNIFPNFQSLAENTSGFSLDNFQGEWKLVIGDRRGRLHVALTRGRVGADKGPEVIRLQLTARGPVDSEKDRDLWTGFDLGHDAIVRYFTAVTSSVAHQSWKRRT